MKWLLLLGGLLWSASAFGQAQGWSSDQDGMNFALADVGTLQVNDMAGTGTRCAAVDSTGAFLPMSVACNAGTVTSVSATAPLFITGGASPTPNVVGHDLIFGGASTTGGQNLGSISTAPLGCVTSGGDCVVDGLTLAGGLHFDTGTGTETLANSSTCGTLTAVSGSTTSGLTCSSIPGAAANGVAYFNAIGVLDEDAANFGWNDSSGFMTFGQVGAPSAGASTKLVCWGDSTGEDFTCKSHAGVITHGAQTKTNTAGVALTALDAAGSWTTQTFQPPLTACTDYVSVSCQGATSDIDHTAGSNSVVHVIAIEADGAMKGDLLATSIATPAAPSAGHIKIYGNTTADNAMMERSNGNVTHMMQTASCGAGSFFSGSADDGTYACTTGKLTKLPFYIQDVVSSAFLTGSGWVPTSSNKFGPAGATSEVPNDFLAGHVDMKFYLQTTVGVAGIVTCSITINGSIIGGTSITFTPGTTTTPVMLDNGVIATGSASANDTYGVFCSGTTLVTGATLVFGIQGLLTP